MKAATCHPDRFCYAKGLCRICYKNVLKSTPRIRKIALCHPDRKHKAKGLCEACYCKQRRPARPSKRRLEKILTRKYIRRKYLNGPLPDKVQKMLDGWLPKLEDPAIVVDLVRKIFSTQKELRGVYTA
jgi:hypothetical protein